MNNQFKNPFSLDGKTIFITGASGGIGRATAIVCSKLGARVIISGRDERKLNETFELLSKNDNLKIAFDLKNTEKIPDFLDFIGRVDAVVHCAGISGVVPVRQMSKSFLEEVIELNFHITANLIQYQIAKNYVNNGGSILLLSSIAAITGKVGVGPYSASKAALLGFMRPLALEMAKKGIRVNALCPGIVRTPLLNVSEEWIEEQSKKYPLGIGKPEDIANCIAYFISDASKKITGSIFSIDGGIPFT